MKDALYTPPEKVDLLDAPPKPARRTRQRTIVDVVKNTDGILNFPNTVDVLEPDKE